jgi:hypothetical protein
MNLKKFQNKIKHFGIVLSVVFGFMVLSSSTAQAQYRDNRGYGRNDRYGNVYGNNMYRVAQEYGYRDGANRGMEDGQKRKSYNPEKASAYKKGTNGYSSSYRNKDAYKRTYRDAFRRGYDEGYSRYGRYNNRRYGNNGAMDAIRRIILGY